MQRAAAREEKVEKVEEEVKHDVSFGSTPTISRKWYFFFPSINSNNVYCFHFLMHMGHEFWVCLPILSHD